MPKSKKIVADNDEVAVLKNQLARALADYANLTKRYEVDKENWVEFAGERILLRILPLLDMLEFAQKHINDPGLAITIAEFKKLLNEEGLEEINVMPGDDFSEELQEAVEVVSGKNSGKVAESVLSGWKFKEGKVLRHAKVKVYK